MKFNKNRIKKVALSLSTVMLLMWFIMGTGTSLAWFTDTDEEIKNVFHFAEFDLEVSYKAEDGKWKSIEGSSELFDDEALYEPGFTQVVYLKVENKGDVPFLFDTAVSVTDYTPGVNMFGQRFYLQNYLLFGVVSNDNEQALYDTLADRDLAKTIANTGLGNYASEESTLLEAGGATYMALIVYMPEHVDNVANYREGTVPKVELGVIVRATQLTD